MKYYHLSISLFLGIKCLNFLSTLWVEMVPIGFTLESWKDKQISGKWVGRNTTNWLGLDSPPPLLFPPASFLWENFWSQIQISCPTILGRLSFFADLHNTQHFYTSFLACQKSTGAKKSEHLNCREASLPSCLKFWNAKKQLQKFSKIYRQVKWLPSSRCRYQKQASMRWEKIVSERTRSRKNGSPVCSYNPIQAKKSFLWVTFLRGFQQCVLKSQNKGNKEYKMRSSIFQVLNNKNYSLG